MNIVDKTKIIVFGKAIDGGTGNFFLDIYAFNKQDYFKDDIIFLYYCLEKPKYRIINHENIYFFHNSHNYYPLIFSLFPRTVLLFIKDLYSVYKLISKEKPSIGLGVDAYCNLLLLINKVILRREIKVICTTHINLSSTIRAKTSKMLFPMLRNFIHFFYMRADALITVSKQVAVDLKTYFNLDRTIAVVYYGHKLSDSSVRERGKRNSTTIVSVGRLVPQKDFKTLIEAFSILDKKIENCMLWIVGDGDERVKLQELVNNLGLRNKVLFLGWKQNIETMLKNADVFVLSSKREGFPYVLLEALAAGIPIISSNSPYGPAEILDNGKYGSLVPVGDSKAMSEAMYRIISDQKIYNQYVQKSLERANFFSLDKMLYQYAQVIENVINRP